VARPSSLLNIGLPDLLEGREEPARAGALEADPLVEGHGRVNGVMFGMMFIAVALSFSFIAVLQIRTMERQNDAD